MHDNEKKKPTDDDLMASEARHVAIVLAVTVTAAVLMAVILGNTGLGDDVSFIYPVALVGTVGGTANNVQRLRRLKNANATITDRLDQRLVIAQIYFSPVIGGVFACLAYGLFMSGILQGEFFPSFGKCQTSAFDGYEKYASCNPDTNGDASMAMVWGFIAGFAERFVPNAIDSIIPGSDADNA